MRGWRGRVSRLWGRWGECWIFGQHQIESPIHFGWQHLAMTTPGEPNKPGFTFHNGDELGVDKQGGSTAILIYCFEQGHIRRA